MRFSFQKFLFHPLTLGIAALFLIFCKSFFREFGLHNDYALLWKYNYPLGFIEAETLVTMGRWLGALLISAQTRLLNHVSDFTWMRVVLWLHLCLLFGILIVVFQRRVGLDLKKSCILAFSLCVLPPAVLSVVWATQWAPFFIASFLAVASYAWLDCSKTSSWPLTLKSFIGPLIVILLAFFIYPLNALFVTALSSAKILFSCRTPQDRNRIFLRDAAFTGLALSSYLLLDRLIVHPFAVGILKFNEPYQQEYQFTWTTDLMSKAGLLKDSVLTSFGGSFHLLWGDSSAIIPVILISVCLLISHFFFQIIPKQAALTTDQPVIASEAKKSLTDCFVVADAPPRNDTHNSRHARLSAEALDWRTLVYPGIYFILSLMPMLAAKHYVTMKGYRVLFVASSIVMMLVIFALDRLLKNTASAAAKEFLKAGFILLIGIQAVCSAITVKNTVGNASRELGLVQEALNRPLFGYNNFALLTVSYDARLIPQRLPYEFGLMMSEYHHWAALLDQARKAQGLNSQYTVAAGDGLLPPIPPGTFILDLKALEYPAGR